MGKKFRKKQNEEKGLVLDEVLNLGGTQDDFNLLKDLKSGNTVKSQQTLKDKELRSFFDSLKFPGAKPAGPSSKDTKTEQFPHQATVKRNDKAATVKTNDKATKVHAKLKKNAPVVTETNKNHSHVGTEGVHHQALPKAYAKILELSSVLPSKKLLSKPSSPWFANDIFKLKAKDESYNVSSEVVERLKALGEQLLKNECKLFEEKKAAKESKDDAWMKTVVTAGTLSDKVAAYILLLQNAPIHNKWCLDSLLTMLKKKGKREAVIGLESLQGIFLSDLLPDHRKLRHFHQQPFDTLEHVFTGEEQSGVSSKRMKIQLHLLQWAFEDYLKSTYAQFVNFLRDYFLQDPLDAIKSKGMKAVLELLMAKPEQEKELLTMLVNKLGDPNNKIASKALHMLNCLGEEHPLMQAIIVRAVRDLLLRPNVNPKCQYYCICFLSRQILSAERRDVADLLIQIYLGFFKAAVSKKEVDNKLLSAILTGVNRAYPYASQDNAKIMEELDVLYRTVHVSSFGTTVQALMLLFQILSSRDELTDRYFNALYSSLLHAELPICTNKHPMFLNLVFRSLKADSSQARVQAFLKRLTQTCTLQRATYTSAMLVLITELLRARPGLLCFFDVSRFSAKTNDVTCEVDAKKDLDTMFGEDSDEEHFADVDEEGLVEKTEKSMTSENSWVHRHKNTNRSNTKVYDPAHRNPIFSNAESVPLWELHRYFLHFHPSVSKFSSDLLQITKQEGSLPERYPGDPLQDFTIMRFLDKYVYRNPKANQNKEARKKVSAAPFRRKNKTSSSRANAVPANAPEFLQKKNHSPEELFLQKYFTLRAKNENVHERTVETMQGPDDIEDVSDDEFESYLSSAEGRLELDGKYDFAEGAAAPGAKRGTSVTEEMDDEEDGDSDEFDDAPDPDDEGDENPFDEDGMGFMGVEDDEEEESFAQEEPASRKKSFKRKLRADEDNFGMLLESNAGRNFSGSAAASNAKGSSAKQLSWERKREERDVIAQKRARKNNSFSAKKGGGANKAKRSGQHGRRVGFKGRKRN